MLKTRRSHWSCSVVIQCLAPKARPLLTMVRYNVWIVLFWHSKCSTHITLNRRKYQYIVWSNSHKMLKTFSSYLAVAVWLILNNATRWAFSAFLKGCVNVVFNFVYRYINYCPLLITQLFAAPHKIHFSGGHHWSEHLQLSKHLQPQRSWLLLLRPFMSTKPRAFTLMEKVSLSLFSDLNNSIMFVLLSWCVE